MFLFPVLALLSMTRSLAHGLQGVYAIYVWLPSYRHVMFILLHVTNLLWFVSLLNIYSCLLSTYWVVLNFTLFTASSNLRITKMSNSCFYYKNNLNMYYKVQFKFWVFFLLEILIDPLKRLKNLLHLITIDILGPYIIYYLFIYWFSST